MSYSRGWTFTWEKGRQLKTATKGSDSLTFKYNANGIRTSKTVNGVEHKYILDGAKILRETYGTVKLDFLYDNEDGICGLKHNNTPYYFCKNLQGDIIVITNKDGQVVARYTYDAWGVCTDIWDASGVGIASINPFRYRGYYWDATLNLYYLQSRYFDPVVGRFLNGDEQLNGNILSSNIFAYCENNSVNYIDFNGTDAIWITRSKGADFPGGPYGHSGLLIQEKQKWYYVSYEPFNGGATNIQVIQGYIDSKCIDKKGKVDFKKAFVIYKEKKFKLDKYDKQIYLKGDFSKK